MKLQYLKGTAVVEAGLMLGKRFPFIEVELDTLPVRLQTILRTKIANNDIACLDGDPIVNEDKPSFGPVELQSTRIVNVPKLPGIRRAGGK